MAILLNPEWSGGLNDAKYLVAVIAGSLNDEAMA
jgi:hypothetical protein